MLRVLGDVPDEGFYWQPPAPNHSLAWLIWHIAEVEDNWARDKLEGGPRRFPFGRSVRDAGPADYPPRSALLAYFHEVRRLSHDRLARASDEDFGRTLRDDTFGEITVRQLWAGLATSCAWHGGQIALTARLAKAALTG